MSYDRGTQDVKVPLNNHPIVVPAHAGTQEYQGPPDAPSADMTVVQISHGQNPEVLALVLQRET